MVCIHSVLVIGFIDPPYQVNESDAFATVEFGILNGASIQADISVSIELFFTDLTAISKFLEE